MLHITSIARALGAFGVAALVACGGTPPPAGPDPNDNQQPETEDLSFTDLPEVQIEGELFVPEALGQPGMVRVVPKRKVTLAAQRKKAAGKKASEQDVQILATLLWDESKKSTDKDADKEKALREEMRDALAKVREAKGEEASPVTLKMLAAINFYLGDESAAAEHYGELLAKEEGDEEARTWLAYIALRANDNQRAAELVEGWTADAAKPDQSYVLAWTAFRMRDEETARNAIAAAAKGWKNGATVNAVVGDLHLILARSGTTAEQAQQIYTDLATKGEEVNKLAVFVWLYTFHEAVAQIGDFARAVAALDAALPIKGDQLAPSEKLSILFLQGNYLLSMNAPARTADKYLAALAAADACGDACTAENKEAVPLNMAKVAQHLHTVYATTYDEAYYDPAKKLYDAYLAIAPARADAEQLRSYLSRLEATKNNAPPKSGKHDADRIKERLELRSLAVEGCYEEVLQANPGLEGTVKATLEISDQGEVLGVALDPAAGAEGLAAVSKCLEQEMRAWTFPGRTMPGKTVVAQSYVMSPKAPAAQPAAAPAPAEGGEDTEDAE